MRRGGAKSFVDDLVLGRGVVLSRAATSLRSIETQPWTRRFVCFLRQTHLLLAEAEAELLLLLLLPYSWLLSAAAGPGAVKGRSHVRWLRLVVGGGGALSFFFFF